MTMLLAVDPVHYEAASTCLGVDVAGGLERAYTTLLNDLNDTGEMSGNDSESLNWAIVYGANAREVAKCIETVHVACVKLAAMLQQTGFNHASAEHASGPGAADTHRYNAQATVSPLAGATIPDPARGTGDRPAGLGQLESAIGRTFDYPDGRQDRLRRASHAWSAAAQSVAALVSFVDNAVACIQLQTSPEVTDAVTVCRSMKLHLEDLALACGALSSGCEQQASAIDSVHSDARWFIGQLFAQEALDEILGGLVDEVTLGGGTALAGVANQKKARDLGNAMLSSLGSFAPAVTASVNTMMPAGQTANSVERLLAPILAVTLTQAAVSAVPRTTNTAAANAELAAEAHLRVGARGATLNLSAEERAGGHTKALHVGLSDTELKGRGNPVSSTFLSLVGAQLGTSTNLRANRSKILKWLQGPSPKREFDGPLDPSLGRSYVKVEGRIKPAKHIRTVLVRTASGYRVLTSFPAP